MRGKKNRGNQGPDKRLQPGRSQGREGSRPARGPQERNWEEGPSTPKKTRGKPKRGLQNRDGEKESLEGDTKSTTEKKGRVREGGKKKGKKKQGTTTNVSRPWQRTRGYPHAGGNEHKVKDVQTGTKPKEGAVR